MDLFWSNSRSLALIFCTHSKKNLTFNLSQMNDLHVSIATSLHKSFLWLRLAQA